MGAWNGDNLIGAIILATSLTACSEATRSLLNARPYVAVVDVDGGSRSQQADTVILKVDLTAELEDQLNAVCAIAKAHFPEGHWVNYGPDSSYREITISCDQGEYILRSWHPLFEMKPNLVAASYGVTTLNGRTREEVLRQDDARYVAQRRAFDEIERELRRRFGG